MSSSTTKPQAKATAAKTQSTESKTTKSDSKKPAAKANNPMFNMMKNSDTMAVSHDGLKFIQHEYEQFGVNMEEKD